MNTVTFKDKSYPVDSKGFLMDPEKWDEDFAEGMGKNLGIKGSLTEGQWRVINFIRDFFKQKGECPTVIETCRNNGLFIRDLKELFPTGYLRGACKLAGITYENRFVDYYGEEGNVAGLRHVIQKVEKEEKTYQVDVHGFLVDPQQWDEEFAENRARELMIKGGLTRKHREVIKFLRDSYAKNGEVPIVYETCEKNQIDLDELEQLFPTGYNRGAIKIAGLRVK